APADKGMAIVAVGRAARRRADMRQEQAGPDLPAKAAEVAIRPCGQNIAVAAGLGPVAVPGDAESVAVRGGLGLQRMVALGQKRVFGHRDDVLKEYRFAQIGSPSAHCLFFLPLRPLRADTT